MSDEKEIKRIDIKEFRESGFLQEANRLFFHRLGLALEVKQNDNGTEELGGIWDYRAEPEGILFMDGWIAAGKINRVEKLRLSKLNKRIELGCDIDGVQCVEKSEKNR